MYKDIGVYKSHMYHIFRNAQQTSKAMILLFVWKSILFQGKPVMHAAMQQESLRIEEICYTSPY